MVELLSPAGNFQKMKFAFKYGADAVYLGLKSFSLREQAHNFSIEELKKAVEYAHSLNKKVYLTANIFFHNKHIDEFKDIFSEIRLIDLDGIIISDLGIMNYVKSNSDIPIHVSTQANTTNYMSTLFYKSLGASRVILARELSLKEIKEIYDKTKMELETFVHGAMCIAYSGRCLLSNYFTNKSLYTKSEKMGNMKRIKTRDANLGDCAQSCRWKYYIVESTREGEYLPIEETKYGTYIMSSKDLNLSAHMDKLIKAGISSFKIEGRMKSIYYVSDITRVYRNIIDSILNNTNVNKNLLSELDTVSHREYTTGFYFEENLALAPTQNNKYIRNYKYLGYVIEKIKDGQYLVKAANQIINALKLEVITPYDYNVLVNDYRMIINGEYTEKVQPNQEFILETEANLEEDFIIRSKV